MTATTGAPITATALLVALAACASAPDDLPPVSDAAIVSVQNPVVRKVHAGTFSWLRSSVIHPDPRFDAAQIDRIVRDAIRKALESRGFRYDASTGGQYAVGYLGSLAGTIRDADIDARHALRSSPAAHADPRDYGKATLVIDLVDRESRTSVWRGAARVIVGFDLDERTRRRRTEELISAMIARIRM